MGHPARKKKNDNPVITFLMVMVSDSLEGYSKLNYSSFCLQNYLSKLVSIMASVEKGIIYVYFEAAFEKSLICGDLTHTSQVVLDLAIPKLHFRKKISSHFE